MMPTKTRRIWIEFTYQGENIRMRVNVTFNEYLLLCFLSVINFQKKFKLRDVPIFISLITSSSSSLPTLLLFLVAVAGKLTLRNFKQILFWYF
jgi:hypothetical protein